MKKNPVETILGFFVLIFTGVFLFFAASRVDKKNITGYNVTANFMKVGGLEVGSDVRISGIKVGSVISTVLNQDTYTADVKLSIDNSVKLPIDTVAAIADVGVMGGKYVRLEPGQSQAILRNNGRIMNTKNYKSLEDSISEFIFLSTK
ncbi:MAG: MCE family protein [Alphaproteobacteria bacterium]|nr:MCE family protein [Alphaproteobacteria bacterium]MBQ3117407.1 MCE family protein [Alphaproteobacteria bacterium]MBQ6854829.1 MCE family protein [Alphaproteobacteria bacterium]MBQ8558054.1 MCE family protein [Alphaproteobacteria bacterium]MBR3913435.1 MCE family protein [Alphaproteobacteria bacterium]